MSGDETKKASLGHGVHQYPSNERGVLQVILAQNSTLHCTVGSILWSSGNIDFELVDSHWGYFYGARYTTIVFNLISNTFLHELVFFLEICHQRPNDFAK